METKNSSAIDENCESTSKQESRDANGLLAMGAGAGVLGTGAALLTGAVCPLCIVFTPALIGAGLVKHWKIRNKNSKQE